MAELPVCRPKKQGDSKSKPITFADVAGVDTAKEELLEVVACLRDASRYSKLNAKTPSGVLLTGPPGTGKTLLGMPSAQVPLAPLPLLLDVALLTHFSDKDCTTEGQCHPCLKP